ncbi:uncharacterized protein V1513DRAFT_441640 [Lipomyces chichibuensis]|uniref:uncharacterized protein n=1 Tax=Lipomyces chichibuensis TaxID=1546026 RepID=UPI0033433015
MSVSNNSLFLKWLLEWQQQSESLGSKSHHTYKKAHDTLKACPVPFAHPREMLTLKGFGQGICGRLEKKLKEYCIANGLAMPNFSQSPMERGPVVNSDELPNAPAKKPRKFAANSSTASKSQENYPPDNISTTESVPSKKPRARKPKQYVPTYRSGAYAILLVLYEHNNDPIAGNSALAKNEIIRLGQPLCDASFEVPAGSSKDQSIGSTTASHYTAWASIKMLIKQELVIESGKRSRTTYQISHQGIEIAKNILKVEKATNGVDSVRNGSPVHPLPTSSPTRRQQAITARKSTNESNMKCMTWPPWHVAGGDSDDDDSFPSEVADDQLQQWRQPLQQTADGKTPPALMSTATTALTAKSTTTDSVSSTAGIASSSRRVTADTTSAAAAARSRYLTTSILSSISQTLPPASVTLPQFTPKIWNRGSFSVNVIVDNREIQSQKERDFFSTRLNEIPGVDADVRALGLGDTLWIAKHKRTGEEVVLEHIAERKRLDDLMSSIKDGRFHEQKYRLMRSGLRSVTYIVEESPGVDLGVLLESVQTAISSTQVVNGFFLKRSSGIEETVRYLGRLTQKIKEIYEDKELHVIPGEAIDSRTYLSLMSHLHSTDPQTSYHISFPDFQTVTSKNNNLTVRDVFLRMLLTIRGVSWEKAIEIQKHFPTPRHIWMELNAEYRMRGEQAARNLVASKCGLESAIARKRIGPALSSRIAEIWGPVSQRNDGD